MVVIVMLMMIKQWSEFALPRLVGGSWGGPGQELHTAQCLGLVVGAGSLYTNYTPLELQPGPTYNHTYAHNL